jgi:hypothetical protein
MMSVTLKSQKKVCEKCGHKRGVLETLWCGENVHEGFDSLCWQCHKMLEKEKDEK